MLQARQLGKELYVGVHSDEDILANKGPTVMRLDERICAVDACKWSTEAVPDSPYVTEPLWMDKYGCKYVVHGDDITTDANGNDCYQEVKDIGRFVVVKRTPNISTTDLVGRMLLLSKTHHYRKLIGEGDIESHPLLSRDNIIRFQQYATDSTGLAPGSGVYVFNGTNVTKLVAPKDDLSANVANVNYVDGGFDLFHPGHVEALHEIKKRYPTTPLIVGIHDDATINSVKGLNYPIMNMLERSLCVLQCKYVDGVVLGAPYEPTIEFISILKDQLNINVVKLFHGPTPIRNHAYDKLKDLLEEIGPHAYDEMNTEFIVRRVLDNRNAYEERQRKKGWKSELELKLQQEEKSNMS